MKFWNIKQSKKCAFILEDGKKITYEELGIKANHISNYLKDISTFKCLGFIYASNQMECIYAYLSALNIKHSVLLLDQNINDVLSKQLIDNYRPDWIFVSADKIGDFKDNYEIYLYVDRYCFLVLKDRVEQNRFINEDLALLLSTSGTTGSSKLVRLSYENIQANAKSIKEYLNISSGDRPITTLPLFYSYGLSVINSHLLAGATILLTERSIVQNEFWGFLKDNRATTLAGVPYSYHLLIRMGFKDMEIPSLKTLTQAGGHLSPRIIKQFYEISTKKNYKFYVMYGQTEATARISYLPFEKLEMKIGSIGIAIPNGRLEIDNNTSEIIYSGPNVMMGYCKNESDLSLGNVNNGVLYTGDIGYTDSDNYIYISGRKSRFIKLFGLRINLDDVERFIESELKNTVACIGYDDKNIVVLTDCQIQQVDNIKQKLATRYSLQKRYFNFITVEKILTTGTGKVDYASLLEEYRV